MKIVLINNGLSGGGTERASVSFAHYLLEAGYEVTILALYKSKPFYKLNPDIRCIEPDFSREQNSTYGYIFKMMKYVRKNVKALKPNTVLSYNEWTNAYVLLSCIGLKIPMYVSERMHPKAKLPMASEVLRNWLYPRASGVVVQTTFGKKVIQEKTGSRNVVVIPNAVNAIEPLGVTKKKQIISIGRLEPVKGHRYLIEAFSKIVHLDWHLCLVGDGSQRESLIKLTQDLGLAERIIFKGHQLDFRKDLSESEIYVLPSVKEGYPNSLIEAMSLPIACISGDYYEGEHDLVKDRVNGLLVPPCDSQALSNAISVLIMDEGLRNKLKQAAYSVRQDLAFSVVANQLKEFILNEKVKEKS